MTAVRDSKDEWAGVLPHRNEDEAHAVIHRIEELGGDLARLKLALSDAGDSLASSSPTQMSSNEALLHAVLAAEVQAWAQAVSNRAAVVRARMINAALPGHSLAQIAQKLNISKQAVHKATKNSNASAPHKLSIETGFGHDNHC